MQESRTSGAKSDRSKTSRRGRLEKASQAFTPNRRQVSAFGMLYDDTLRPVDWRRLGDFPGATFARTWDIRRCLTVFRPFDKDG